MKKSQSRSLQRTAAFAATLAALGVSVGVQVESAHAQYAGPQGKWQNKHELAPGASQHKYESNQQKIVRGNPGAPRNKPVMPENTRGGMPPLSGGQGDATISTSGKIGTGATQDKVRTGATQGKGLTGPASIGGAGGKQ
jgi:hypothetical protein